MDEELEKLIDEAGRDKVFARARTLGWRYGDMIEKWMWRQICYEMMSDQPRSEPEAMPLPPQRLDEALFGFRLF